MNNKNITPNCLENFNICNLNHIDEFFFKDFSFPEFDIYDKIFTFNKKKYNFIELGNIYFKKQLTVNSVYDYKKEDLQKSLNKLFSFYKQIHNHLIGEGFDTSNIFGFNEQDGLIRTFINNYYLTYDLNNFKYTKLNNFVFILASLSPTITFNKDYLQKCYKKLFTKQIENSNLFENIKNGFFKEVISTNRSLNLEKSFKYSLDLNKIDNEHKILFFTSLTNSVFYDIFASNTSFFIFDNIEFKKQLYLFLTRYFNKEVKKLKTIKYFKFKKFNSNSNLNYNLSLIKNYNFTKSKDFTLLFNRLLPYLKLNDEDNKEYVITFFNKVYFYFNKCNINTTQSLFNIVLKTICVKPYLIQSNIFKIIKSGDFSITNNLQTDKYNSFLFVLSNLNIKNKKNIFSFYLKTYYDNFSFNKYDEKLNDKILFDLNNFYVSNFKDEKYHKFLSKWNKTYDKFKSKHICFFN